VRFRCQGLTATDGTFTDVTLEVREGEILGLYGLIGAGRTEWAQAVFGLRTISGGEIWIDRKAVIPDSPGAIIRAGVAYVPEDRLRQGLCRGLSVRANIVLASLRRLSARFGIARSAEMTQAESAIRQLAIRARSPEQIAGTLSGGNQQKVVLARWLGTEPKVLVLDEPTRGVDVGAKAEIYTLIHRLAAEGRAVVMISSDLPEVMAQSDRIGVFRGGHIVGTFDPHVSTAEEIAAAAYPQSTSGAQRRQVQEPSTQRKQVPHLLALRARGDWWREAALMLILLLLFGFLEWRTGRFLQAANLHNLATDAALLSFCAVGTSLVILAGGLDISLGALMALSAGIAGRQWEDGASLPVVFATAIVVGGLGGFLNAALSLIGRVHPIVVTLGTMSVYRGLTLWWLGQDVFIHGDRRNWLTDDCAGLPLVVWAGILLVTAAWLILRRTVPGHELYALGSNPAAAHRIGIERRRIWLWAFTLQGMLVGLAGLFYLARSGNLQPSGYEGETLRAIAAVVVGGAAITGGRGSVWGVALGCVFLVALPLATPFLGISANWDKTLAGAAMVMAVAVDALWRRRRA
jgi:ribose/xylose/arabinose/galactoside ABC-type transport system permease subunit/ABC-type multidrug transport system ATPase subunit